MSLCGAVQAQELEAAESAFFVAAWRSQLGVLKWLLEQRNSFGGFSSTQDTVLGLEALSQYTVSISSSSGTLTVTGYAQTFHL